MTRYKAVVATKELLEVPTRKGKSFRQFTDKTLTDLHRSAIGKPINLGFRGTTLAIVKTSGLVSGPYGYVFIEFEADGLEALFEDKYIVPGFRVTSSKGTDFVTVRCMDFAVTDKPLDKTLSKVEIYE